MNQWAEGENVWENGMIVQSWVKLWKLMEELGSQLHQWVALLARSCKVSNSAALLTPLFLGRKLSFHWDIILKMIQNPFP